MPILRCSCGKSFARSLAYINDRTRGNDLLWKWKTIMCDYCVDEKMFECLTKTMPKVLAALAATKGA